MALALFDLLWLSGSPFSWIIPFAGLVLGIWVWVDASDKTPYPAIWGLLVMLCWPVFFPLYYFLLFAYHQRPKTRHMAEELEMKRMPQVLGRTAMDREYMLAKMQEGPGTMYDPEAGMSRKMGGHRYRALAHVDELQLINPPAAWEYLTELYETAESEHDTQTTATCEWYMRQQPDGNQRFTHWLKHRHDPPPEEDEAETESGEDAAEA